MISFEELRINTLYEKYLLRKRIAKKRIFVLLSKPCIPLAGFFCFFYFVYLIRYIFFQKTEGFIEWPFYVFPLCLFFWIVIKKRSEEALEMWLNKKYDRIDNDLKRLPQIEQIIKDNQDFVLYLRDFASGSKEFNQLGQPIPGSLTLGIDHPLLRPLESAGKPTTLTCIYHFSNKYPLVMLYNRKEKTVLPENVYLLYPSDNTWLEIVKDLSRLAKYVIIDFERRELLHINDQKRNIQKSLQKEFEALLELNQKKLILIVNDETAGKILFNTYKSLFNIIYYYIQIDGKGLNLKNFDEFEAGMNMKSYEM